MYFIFRVSTQKVEESKTREEETEKGQKVSVFKCLPLYSLGLPKTGEARSLMEAILIAESRVYYNSLDFKHIQLYSACVLVFTQHTTGCMSSISCFRDGTLVEKNTCIFLVT